MDNIKNSILNGKTVLGIEFGSTRIKGILIDDNFEEIASGSYSWENKLENGFWTYGEEEFWTGLQSCFNTLSDRILEKYDIELTKIGSIGFSAMMHGYIALDENDNLLVPFRTWRNTTTDKASTILTNEFNFNIPHRWSVAHLYEAILNKEPHVKNIKYITTLAGYIHYKLTGEKVIGIGDASGMFPINSDEKNYDNKLIAKFNELISKENLPWKIEDILPKVLLAGDNAGVLKNPQLIHKFLEPGIPFCPPEGDAGTGMIATNSISKRSGNVSAGTSIFAMIVLEKMLDKAYREIDIVTTPVGDSVAMVHCNNCTNEINAWANIFKEMNVLLGNSNSMDEIFDAMFKISQKGDTDCSNVVSFNYLSGEPITNTHDGRPILLRKPESNFNLANFMLSNLYSSVATLKIGMDILYEENVKLDLLLGHGGFFKTENVGQDIMALATNSPVGVMETAGEGGAFGMAILAKFLLDEEKDLSVYLKNTIFKNSKINIRNVNETAKKGFDEFIDNYKNCLEVEKSAINNLI